MVGIDEVGRGSLAGPVTVAAVAIPEKLNLTRSDLVRLRDSKKLSPKQREQWFQYIRSHNRIFYALASVSSAGVDKLNVSQAANLAASRAFFKLMTSQVVHLKKKRLKIFLDAGLSLPADIPSRTFIKGDERFNCVKLASIIAKVSRDRLMAGKFHKKFPQYGFVHHKGYGTKEHFLAIKKHGSSPIHRLTFIKKYNNINLKRKA